MDQVEYIRQMYGREVDAWNSAMLLYNSAIKEISTKIEILNDEFQHTHQYNPIEYVKTRVKKPESIIKKLRRYGYSDNIENMVTYCNDIAGLRIVCSFTNSTKGSAISIKKAALASIVEVSFAILYKNTGCIIPNSSLSRIHFL